MLFSDHIHLIPSPMLSIYKELHTPAKIQRYLDDTPYNITDQYNSPISVIARRSAHCFDGACFAASVLWYHGYPPLIVDMRAENDDDHVIAVFKRHGHFGCVAKSNTTVLRYREPVYASIRELVMSFFDFYYNLNGDKCLREFTEEIDLRQFNGIQWLCNDDALIDIADHLDKSPHHTIVNSQQILELSKVEGNVYKAGLLGADENGLYKPSKP